MKISVKVFLIVCIGLTLLFAEGEQQFAELGDFQLENAKIIKDCRIGYRILGQMNPDKSNIILYPTWFGGSSEHVSGLVGPGKFVDNTELCVIVVDAHGIIGGSMGSFQASEQFTSWNKAGQLRAMQHHNIFRHFDGSEVDAATAIKAELLMIVAATDHLVNPIPAQNFATILGCDIVVLENNCGHLAIGCEMERCSRIVSDFFKR